MSIEFNSINPASQDALRNKRSDITDSKQASHNEAQSDAPAQSTTVSLSNTAQLMSQVESTLKDSPDVDIDRVNELKAAISNGSYVANAENMAQKMLDLD